MNEYQDYFPIVFTHEAKRIAETMGNRLSDVPAQNNNVCIGESPFYVFSRCVYYKTPNAPGHPTKIEKAEVVLKQD